MKLLTSFYQINGFDFSEAHSTATSSRSRKFCLKVALLVHLVYICINLKYQIHIQAELFTTPTLSVTLRMLAKCFCHFSAVSRLFVSLL